MFASVINHTVYHSKLLSLYFCFVLEFNMWQRIGWVHPRVFCAQYLDFCVVLCRSLFVSFLKAIELYLRDLFYHDRYPLWHLQTFGHWIVCLSIYVFLFFWYLLITPSIFCNFPLCTLWYLLITSLFFSRIPICCRLITLLVSSDHSSCIFCLTKRYLLISPLFSSDYPFCTFLFPPQYLLINPFVSSAIPLFIFLFPLLISSNFLCGGYWHCQSLVGRRGNENPSFDKEQTTQWPKEKVQKDKQQSIKHTHKTKIKVR